MAERKTKIVLEKLIAPSSFDNYRVIRLVNRTLPELGAVLKRAEVDMLIKETENLTVEIVPKK